VNYTTDDLGRSVIAVGAPGSVERMRCERPALIERMNAIRACSYDCRQSKAIDVALDEARAAGVRSGLETRSIILASDYAEDAVPGSVAAMILAVTS
jgi:hypothetical protein